jgi:Transglycosylase associated protein
MICGGGRTSEGTVVDILLGIVGAVLGGWLFNLFGGTGVTGSTSTAFTVRALPRSARSSFWRSTTPSSAAACYEFGAAPLFTKL